MSDEARTFPKPYHGNCNYQGSGYYTHYKGGKYYVLGLIVKEDTVDKENTPEDGEFIEGQIEVVYLPISPGSLLPRLVKMNDQGDTAVVGMWGRGLRDFNAFVEIDHNHYVRRFEKSEVE